MAEKVKVSREVAEAIEYIKENLVCPFENTMRILTDGGFRSECDKKAFVLNDMGLLEVAALFVNDYEIELTPEEKVQKEYDVALEDRDNSVEPAYFRGYARGIEFAAKQFGYDVKETTK